MSFVDFGHDRSVMLMLTPDEVKNMIADFAERYHQARTNGCPESVDDLASSYYNMSADMLQGTDPTRFLSNN